MFVEVNFDEKNPITTVEERQDDNYDDEENDVDYDIDPQEDQCSQENIGDTPDSYDSQTFEELLEIDPEALKSLKSLSVRNYEEIAVTKEHLFVTLKFNEKIHKIRKSTLAWLFDKESRRVSTDRLMRFYGS